MGRMEWPRPSGGKSAFTYEVVYKKYDEILKRLRPMEPPTG